MRRMDEYMCTHVYLCICMDEYMCTHVYLCICMDTYMYCIHVSVYIWMQVHLCLNVCMHDVCGSVTGVSGRDEGKGLCVHYMPVQRIHLQSSEGIDSAPHYLRSEIVTSGVHKKSSPGEARAVRDVERGPEDEEARESDGRREA
jgi:hypothetical protein